MGHLLRVAVVQSQNDLLEDQAGFFLWEEPLLDDLVEELASRAEPESVIDILGHHVDVSGVLEGLIELDDVGVVHLLQDLDLVEELVVVFDFPLRNLFDCSPAALSRSLYSTLQDRSECSRAQWLCLIITCTFFVSNS